MSNTQHTPGPWTHHPDDNIITTADGRCLLEWQARSLHVTLEERDANARLIAAAPDLLEACQTFAEWLRREEEGFVAAGRTRDTPEGEAEWREWYYGNIALCSLAQDQARAAIAKATGGAA
jgi:hypothetical protein